MTSSRSTIFLAVILFILLPQAAWAQQPLLPPQVQEPPVLDGFLSEAVWTEAALADGLIQQRPFHGQPSSEKTEIRLVYTTEALWIGFFCHESSPEQIRRRSLGRDAELWDDDYLVVVLDTFHDRQNGYFFQLNPNGARTDALFRNEGENRNFDWDGPWSVATHIGTDGWGGEIRIPWDILRFPRGEVLSMGINFERQRRDLNEQSQWAPVERQYSIYHLSSAGTMEGLRGIQPGHNVMFRPYVLSRTERGDISDADAFSRDDWTTLGDVGLDAKVGLSSDLNLDLTVNTDFAEVEVDDQEVNLTRFPLFFPEKREFFLEKRDFFSFGSPANQMFFSRRVGLDDGGNALPIHYGTRLTGKVGRTDIGLLDIQTGRKGSTPRRRFDVLRLGQDIGTRSRVGFMAVSRHSSDMSGLSKEVDNRAFGLDADVSPTDQMDVALYAGMVDEKDIGSDNITYGGRGRWSHPLGSITYLHESIGTDYRPAVGFVPRSNIDQDAVGWSFTPEPNWKWIRRFDNYGTFYWIQRRHAEFETRYIHVHPTAIGHGGQVLGLFYDYNFERLVEEFDLGDGVVFPAGTYRFDQFGLDANTDPSLPLYAGVQWLGGDYFDGTMTMLQAELSAVWSSHLKTSIDLERNHVERKDVTGSDHKIDGDIVRLRVDWNPANSFSVRLFSQWNSQEEQLISQIRFHYLFGRESDLYLVITDGRADDHHSFAPRHSQWALKLSYAWFL